MKNRPGFLFCHYYSKPSGKTRVIYQGMNRRASLLGQDERGARWSGKNA